MKKLFSLFVLSFCFMFFGPLSAMQNGQQAQLDRQLLQAAAAGNLKQVQEAVRMGANVNARDEHSFTPLHLATDFGHEAIADFFIA